MYAFTQEGRVIPGLEIIKKQAEAGRRPLYQNRELITVVYEEDYIVTFEYVIGTNNIMVVYTPVELNAENGYRAPGKMYIEKIPKFKEKYPDVSKLIPK